MHRTKSYVAALLTESEILIPQHKNAIQKCQGEREVEFFRNFRETARNTRRIKIKLSSEIENASLKVNFKSF